MSSLYASRWADTPPAEENPQKSVDSSLFASRWATTPPEPDEKKTESNAFGPRSMDTPPLAEPALEQDEGGERLSEDTGEPTIPAEAELKNHENVEDVVDEEPKTEEITNDTSNDSDVAANTEKPLPELPVNEPEKDESAAVEGTDTAPTSPSKSRLEAPRLKKKLLWRGKNLVVSIPNLDYDALGLTKPLSFEEIEARLKAFEEAGYNMDGFDIPPENEVEDDPVYSKSIFPDELETRPSHQLEGAKVRLPDLAKWASYMDQLTEQKLAALGVSMGSEEPLAAPSPSASRQSSAQYPPLPFSPPLPSNSAASLGRPGMIRSHSHAMSVASPISPLTGPLGHMHRHSTFSGPVSFQQLQQSAQQPAINGVRGFPIREQLAALQTNMAMRSGSPLNQFVPPGFNPVASPAQLGAIRNENAAFHGPGSPLNQQSLPQSAIDYSRNLAEDQLSRQNAFSHLVQQGPSPNGLTSNGVVMQSTPSLPQLPEEEEEEGEIVEESVPEPEQQPERPAYVPPHKRAELNANIAVPTPRGHRHNISEGLERDILESEKRHEVERQNYIVVEEESSGQTSQSEDSSARAPQPIEKDPLSQDYPVQETMHSHKKGASRYNITAPTFKFNPGASFQPAGTAFTFGAAQPKPNGSISSGHNRQQSSGTFNVAAPEFKPAGVPSLPKSEFSFSTKGPAFAPAASSSGNFSRQEGSTGGQGSSIFGKVEIPEFVKPTRRSKAIAIKKPDDAPRNVSVSQSEVEDSEGRIAQSEDRLKRQRKTGDSGDQIPQFAEPTPIPAPAPNLILKSQPAEPKLTLNETDDGTNENLADLPKEAAESVDDAFDHDFDLAYGDRDASDSKATSHSHKRSTSLSALAKPFAPEFPSNSRKAPTHDINLDRSQSDPEEGEVKEDNHPPTSQPASREPSAHSQDKERELTPKVLDVEEIPRQVATPPVNDAAEGEPSFAEIDAVMRQLNEAEADQSAQERASISPLPSPGSHPMPGVTYLPEWNRSDAPSPSPRRRPQPLNSQADSSFTIHDLTDSGERVMNGWPQVNRLNKAAEIPTSDWSADFLAQDDEKLNQRSNILDSHIDNLIGRVLDKRLQPLEESLLGIQSTLSKRPISRDIVQKRSSSAVESDADDEDELSEEQRHRPISRGKDKKIDHIKSAVIEALREQSPQRHSHPPFDPQDLHSYLADMKASFARAAATSLELDDIRAVVEDAVGKQSEAMMPIAVDASEKEKAHRRQKSELEARLNQTLAGMLEEANLRRAAEEREAESKRVLQVAEDELRALRDSSRDDDSRIIAAVREKDDLLHRLEQAEESKRDMEEQVKNLEAENAATYATLEEYRMSSSKWRQHIDQATQEREVLENQLSELKQQLEDSQESSDKRNQDVDRAMKERDQFEATISGLEHQLEESRESGNSMRRRLEKLHSDMASAAGQLASEKSTWRMREDEYRAKCDSLEAQVAAHVTSRSQLEEDLRDLRAGAKEASEARSVLDQMRTSNSSLEELARNLQRDLAEQQSLAARFERDFHDAKENARAEVHRVRLSMETDVETANHQVNVVRSELESELLKVRSELENANMEVETAKARHDRHLEEEDGAKREALRKVNLANSVALDEARQKHELSLQQLQADHKRVISHALEDKERSETFLNERLVLSDAKLQLFQDKVLHLEERLEVAKSAAQAAAMSAQSRGAPSAPAVPSSSQEKVSPQALRESILVLQEQLQDRESLIEKLQNQVDNEGPAKAKARDEEIAWLRELLANRSEELTDLINTLARPVFDRNAVRDIAIRIRANLQMEQQEKERFSQDQQSLSEQALASLSNFATPKAAQLSTAFNKWRTNMESSSLKNAQRSSGRPRSNTPSKPSAPATAPPAYMSGLMTPPASNIRNTPSPEATASLPPPRLHSRPTSKADNVSMSGPPKFKSRQPSASSEAPTAALFRSQSYDQDAEDSKAHLQNFEENFEDDNLDDVPDNQPPAFRSLETELEDAGVDEAME